MQVLWLKVDLWWYVQLWEGLCWVLVEQSSSIKWRGLHNVLFLSLHRLLLLFLLLFLPCNSYPTICEAFILQIEFVVKLCIKYLSFVLQRRHWRQTSVWVFPQCNILRFCSLPYILAVMPEVLQWGAYSPSIPVQFSWCSFMKCIPQCQKAALFLQTPPSLHLHGIYRVLDFWLGNLFVSGRRYCRFCCSIDVA